MGKHPRRRIRGRVARPTAQLGRRRTAAPPRDPGRVPQRRALELSRRHLRDLRREPFRRVSQYERVIICAFNPFHLIGK